MKLTFALLIITFLAGCSNMSSTKGQALNGGQKMPATVVLDKEVAAFLASAQTFAIAEFSSTPWGQNVLLQAGEPYFSASGRNCRTVNVLDTVGNDDLELVCEFRNGDWEPVRLVTQLLDAQ